VNELARASTPNTEADPIVDELVDQFARKLQAGESIDVEEFASQHPDQADKLLLILPAMQVLADLGCTTTNSSLDAHADRPATGTLGDFRILREIGRGGMGVVYEAEQISLGRRVALKVLPFASTLDPKQLQRFKNEAQAAAGLHHTNIVPVFATGCERGVHYYAMQYIEGHTLAEVIADSRNQSAGRNSGATAASPPVSSQPRPRAPEYGGEQKASGETDTQAKLSTLPTTQDRAFYHSVARLGIQAADALDYSHDLGVIHRDIKPANMLLDGRGKLWITDFGLAHCQSQAGLTMSGDLVGTLRYMSPEQALAKRVLVDHRTDIYSLGATLYEVLSSEPVFIGTDRQELLRQIAFEEPKSLRRARPSIPVELETIVLKALEKSPGDRYATAKEMGEDLERFVKDVPIRARRPPLTRRVKHWCGRHKPLVTGVAAFLLSALVLASAVLWSQEHRRAAAERAVAEDLREADTWQQQEKWAKALQALERAKARLEEAGLDHLKGEVDKRGRDLALVTLLDRIRLKASRFAYFRSGWDFAGADRAYADMFARSGLDVTGLPPEELARRIQASAIKSQLVQALDHWADIKDDLAEAKGAAHGRPSREGEALRTIARLADDDPWRYQLRDPLAATDPAKLVALAEDPNVLAQPPSSLVRLLGLLDRGFPSKSAEDRAAAKRARETRRLLLRRAQRRYPADFWLNMMLALDLYVRGQRYSDAIGFMRAALTAQPEDPEVHFSLGLFHEGIKEYVEAEAFYRRAIELNPSHADVHHSLGNALRGQQRLAEAEAAYRKAIDIKPDDELRKLPGWFYDLGEILREQRKLPEAEAAYREAIRLMPDYPNAYQKLGLALQAQRKLSDAEAALRESIRLGLQGRDPKAVAVSYLCLAEVMFSQKKLPETEAACRQAIGLNPDLADAHMDLGIVLNAQRKGDDAVAAHQKAIALQPKLAVAHWNLALVLKEHGDFAQSLTAAKRVQELGWKGGGGPRSIAAFIRETERFAQLDAKLPKILSGEAKAADAVEQLALARLCALPCRRLYAAAVGFYSEAFAADPKLVDDLLTNRYNAACAAALAGCSQGNDAARLTPDERVRLRGQALTWLRADLKTWSLMLDKSADNALAKVRGAMRHWQNDSDFDGVRGDAALAMLPEAERREWRSIWQEVRDLGQRAGEKK
jgi:serine/threonine protein kinase/tetratricopeptide (TPR) repeat protein